ncbi:MAG TPA: TIGR03943 family protein [Chloroflexota bacterium]|nr:TIGR03943 family protein [Chloroflexota bacterium]
MHPNRAVDAPGDPTKASTEEVVRHEHGGVSSRAGTRAPGEATHAASRIPPRVAQIVAASPSLLLALLVGKLCLTGTLGYYVNAQTAWIVMFGGVMFAAVGLVSLRKAWRRPDSWRLSRRALVFLVPVVIGLLVPPRPLSGLSGQSSALGALQLAGHLSAGSPGDDFGSWVNDLATHPASTWWSGKRVTLVGFATLQAGMPRRSFIVGRYIVTCCVVDATLVGFPVQLDGGRPPADGSWVQVSGTFGNRFWTDPSGEQYPIIERARLGPVNIPSSPYLSP